MQTTTFKWDGGEREVTRDQILKGMDEFDRDYRGEVPDTGKLWFVNEKGKQYPPKYALSLGTGIPRNEFSGGGQTNRPLIDLGFDLVKLAKTGAEIEDEPDAEVIEAIKTTFGIERDLQHALRAQIEQLEAGLEVTDGGKEKQVAAGRIDITAKDKKGAAVVIELKAGEADRDAIGQILGYMGDLSLENKAVRGILVAGGFAPRAIAAARMVPNLRLEKYSFNFVFTPKLNSCVAAQYTWNLSMSGLTLRIVDALNQKEVWSTSYGQEQIHPDVHTELDHEIESLGLE